MSWKGYIFLTLIFIFIQGIFAMLEMACVSFNKVRLQYWTQQNKLRAVWLSYLLNRPTLLFGVTLIGVNAAMQLGSECSRRFYDSLGLNPDIAPITQIIFVLIFAELAPLFAGRRHAEHVAMLGVPILYFLSFLLRPVILILDWMCFAVNRLFGSKTKEGIYLSREELQHMFEQREEEIHPAKEINTIAKNIFSLKGKLSKDLMIPLNEIQMVPAICTVGEMRALLNYHFTPFLPIYEREARNVFGIVYPRDLIRLEEGKKVAEHARPAWFITENSSVLSILKQFRRNNQSIAVVLDDYGLAIGFLSLDRIIDSIFGKMDEWESFEDIAPRMHHVIVDKTVYGDMPIHEFNRKFQVKITCKEGETFDELIADKLGHLPEKGESIVIDQFELTVLEAPILKPKKIAIRSVF